MQDLIGRTLGHYRVVEKIGAGGMGEVYRAHDERLDRDVAVKVLHEAVAQNADRLARFEREAKAVAALSHSNILEIFDFDAEGDVMFAVTELLEGETLREHLQNSSGPLPWEKICEIGAAVVNGLGAAHGKGVVHRDIKPSNIFLCSDGRVKILDFGLAVTHEVVDSEAETGSIEAPLTSQGTVMGTVGYMAPEQVRGQPADHRSDIFALGVVLYEMLTGKRPFSGSTSVETAAAILKDTPRPLDELRPDLPWRLGVLVERCLEKEARRRTQSALDLQRDLEDIRQEPFPPSHQAATAEPPDEAGLHFSHSRRRLLAGVSFAGLALMVAVMVLVFQQLSTPPQTETPPIRSIAILPLENLTGDPEQAYFVDGLHEELIATFAQISGFNKVIARTSVMGFRNSDTPIREIGKQLGVEAVIDGSVRRSGNTVRTTLQLIEAHTEDHLWTEIFDHEMVDILQLQSEVARAVADAVNLTLNRQEEAKFARSDSVNHEAYEAYLMGNHLKGTGFVEQDLMKAIGFYQLAIEKDPDFARAYSRLAEGYLLLALRFRPATEAMPLALQAALRGIELEEAEGEAHAVLGVIKYTWEWDWADADTAFKRALQLQPNNTQIYYYYSQFLATVLRFEEAVANQRRAVELSPLSRTAQRNLGWVYWATGRYDEAATYLSDFIARYPDTIFGRMILSWTYSLMGRMADGVIVAEEARDHHPAPDDDPFLLMALAVAYGFEEKTDDAEGVLRRLHELRRTRYIPPTYVAFGHYAIGDIDGGYEWMRKACEERHWHAVMLKVFTIMRPDIHADPRIHALIQSMNLPES